MQPLDILILLFVGLGIFVGYRKGFLNQVASLLGFLVGLYLAKEYYTDLAKELSPTIFDSMSFANAISFIAIWLVVPLVFGLIATMIARFLDAVYLGWLNRLLGTVAGAVKYVLLLSLLICIFDVFDSENQILSKAKKENSTLYLPIKSVVYTLFFEGKRAYLEG